MIKLDAPNPELVCHLLDGNGPRFAAERLGRGMAFVVVRDGALKDVGKGREMVLVVVVMVVRGREGVHHLRVGVGHAVDGRLPRRRVEHRRHGNGTGEGNEVGHAVDCVHVAVRGGRHGAVSPAVLAGGVNGGGVGR